MFILAHFVIYFCDLCFTVNSLKYPYKKICTDRSGMLFCCFNYEPINDVCVECRPGFRTYYQVYNSSCMPCADNKYGHKCIETCKCKSYQRCNTVLGCVDKTTTINTKHLQTTMSECSSSTGLLKREIVIYSLLTVFIFLALGMSNLLRKCRKKSKDKETGQGAPNKNQSHSVNQRMAQVDLVHSVYDDIDETIFVENDNIRPQQTKPSAVASIDSSYLFPCHSEDESISSQTSEKCVNKSFVTSFETDQNKTPDNHDAFDNHDTISYLHPYHTIDEDWKEKTHQYDITYSPHIDTDSLFDASVQLTHD